MKITRNKAVTLVTAILLSLMVSSIFAVDFVSAHNPPINVRTWTRIVASPNPVGVNQATYLQIWLTQAPPGAQNDATARWTFNVSITSPTNGTMNLGTLLSDQYGYATTTFLPDTTGTWTVTATFPQTKFTWNSNADQLAYTNDTFLTSTATASFIVQSDPVPTGSIPDYTDYVDWFSLDGSGCQGTGQAAIIGGGTGRCEADGPVKGPSSAHILWTIPLENGGVVGGNNVGVPGQQFFTGSSYWMRFQTYGIMAGNFYYRAPVCTSGEVYPITIVDLRTGTQRMAAGTSLNTIGYSCNGVNVLLSSSWAAQDPNSLTTAWTLSGVPSGTTIVGSQGERLVLAFSSSGSNITQWNSSKCLTGSNIIPSTANQLQFYDFNVSTTIWNGTAWTPFTIPANRTILSAVANNKLLTASSNTGSGQGAYNNASMSFWSVSLEPKTLGRIVGNGTFYQRSTTSGHYVLAKYYDAVNNVVCVAYRELCAWRGLNLNDGKYYDGAPQAQFDFFGNLPNTSTGLGLEHDMDGWCAYGHLYTAQYGGILYCYNTQDMTLNWTYGNAPITEGINIPNSTALGAGANYPNAPTFIGGIADGKIYTYCSEHSINTPIFKGAKIRCVNATNGQEIFALDGWTPCFTSMPAICPPAYGFLIYLDSYDQQIYALAKGPSATTVSAPSEVNMGDKILVTGSITDVSPGTNKTGIQARFPNGVPCISEANMTDFMEYVYMQRPRPESGTDKLLGVNVILSAMAPDGTLTEIGTATSDSTGFYSILWTPPTTGDYKILASFTGTTSYAASNGQASVSVTSVAPVTTALPSLSPVPVAESYLLDFTAAIIAIMVLAGVALILTLRKRP